MVQLSWCCGICQAPSFHAFISPLFPVNDYCRSNNTNSIFFVDVIAQHPPKPYQQHSPGRSWQHIQRSNGFPGLHLWNKIVSSGCSPRLPLQRLVQDHPCISQQHRSSPHIVSRFLSRQVLLIGKGLKLQTMNIKCDAIQPTKSRTIKEGAVRSFVKIHYDHQYSWHMCTTKLTTPRSAEEN